MHTPIARTSFVFVTLFALASTLAGCAQSHGGRVFSSDNWPQQKSSLGKIALYVSGKDPGDPAYKHPAQMNAILTQTLAKFPNATILPPTDAQNTTFSKDLSETDALAYAKSAGADTLCLLNVADYEGQFTIGMGIPYLLFWDLHTRAIYSLRLLDVKTGTLLLHTISYRQSGGLFGFWDCIDPQKNLRLKLESDLKP
jgi:hypothetical protein